MNAGPVAPKGSAFGATGTLPNDTARASLASATPFRSHTTEGRTRMSSITTPAEVPVPGHLLPALREHARVEVECRADYLARCLDDTEDFVEAIEALEQVIAVHRALRVDAEAYPSSVVSLAATYTIWDAASRIADDALDVDEAELYVRRVRECEALQAAAEQPAVMA
jgi:hypothetical protein